MSAIHQHISLFLQMYANEVQISVNQFYMGADRLN